jgi:LuxR family maltose regulon positive regulatory protein
MLSGGMTEREIGHELFLSFNTVHSHVKSVYRKLAVSSRAEAIARARAAAPLAHRFT